MAELKATPRNAALGAIADALMRARELGDKAKIPFTELGLGELVLGKTPEELNEWAYGNAPLRVAGRGTGSLVPQLKQGRAEQVADTLLMLPGAGPLAKASARAVKSVPAAIKHGAEQFAHASAAANPRIVKKPGGNWLHSEGTEYLDGLVNFHDNPAIGEWVRGPLRRYVRKDLGAANSTPKNEYKALASQYLKEAGLTGDDSAMRNAGLYPVRTRNAYFTEDELRQLVNEGDVDAMDTWQRYIIDNTDGYKKGGLVETDDDFAYPGMF